MKKIVSFIMGLVAFATLNAANTANVTLTLTANGGTEASQVKLRLDPSVTSVSGASWFQNLEAVGTVNIYAKVGANMYSQYKYNTLTNLPLEVVTNRRAATLQHYTITFSVLVNTETLYLTDLVLDPNNENPIAIVDGETYEFDVNTTLHPNYVAGTNYVIADRFVINYVAPTPACTTIRENMEVGHYYTICIPQDIVSFNGATFWSMSNRGEGVAYLVEEVAPLNAGQPYIIQAEAEELCVVYGNAVPATEAGTAGALVGTFAAMDQSALNAAATTANSDIYLLFNNELWKVNGRDGNSLPANRAYVVYNELIEENPTPAPGRRVRAIPMQEQTATGVENINASEAATKFVENGQIYIRRGNEVFNLQGQVVK